MLVKTLDKLDRGSKGEILSITDTCERSHCLRRMGLREGVVVEVVSNHDPVMLRFDGCCIAVGREMLGEVTICRCGCKKEDARAQTAARQRAARRGTHS